MVDPNEYLGAKPTAYSRMYLEYEPSPNLRKALREFVTPDADDPVLLAEAYFEIPILEGGRKLEHSPKYNSYIKAYKDNLNEISERQIRLAAYIGRRVLHDKAMNEESLALYFELLPDKYERSHLGKLAIKHAVGEADANPLYGAMTHIPIQDLDDSFNTATINLQRSLGLFHPAVRQRPHTTLAPLEAGLWMSRPMLREIDVVKPKLIHPDVDLS